MPENHDCTDSIGIGWGVILKFTKIMNLRLFTTPLIIFVSILSGRAHAQDHDHWSILKTKFPYLNPETHLQSQQPYPLLNQIDWQGYRTLFDQTPEGKDWQMKSWAQATDLGESFRDHSAQMLAALKLNRTYSNKEWQVSIDPFIDFHPDGFVDDQDLLDYWTAYLRIEISNELASLYKGYEEPRDRNGRPVQYLPFKAIKHYVTSALEELRDPLIVSARKTRIERLFNNISAALFLEYHRKEIITLIEILDAIHLFERQHKSIVGQTETAHVVPTVSTVTALLFNQARSNPHPEWVFQELALQLEPTNLAARIPIELASIDEFKVAYLRAVQMVQEILQRSQRNPADVTQAKLDEGYFDSQFIAYSFDSDYSKSFLGISERSNTTEGLLSVALRFHQTRFFGILANLASYHFPLSTHGWLFSLQGAPTAYYEAKQQLYMIRSNSQNFDVLNSSLNLLGSISHISQALGENASTQRIQPKAPTRFPSQFKVTVDSESIFTTWDENWGEYLEPRYGTALLKFVAKSGHDGQEVLDLGLSYQRKVNRAREQLLAKNLDDNDNPDLLQNRLDAVRINFKDVQKKYSKEDGKDEPDEDLLASLDAKLDEINNLISSLSDRIKICWVDAFKKIPELKFLTSGDALLAYREHVNRVSDFNLENLDEIQSRAGLLDGVQFSRAIIELWPEFNRWAQSMDINGDNVISQTDINIYQYMITQRVIQVRPLN